MTTPVVAKPAGRCVAGYRRSGCCESGDRNNRSADQPRSEDNAAHLYLILHIAGCQIVSNDCSRQSRFGLKVIGVDRRVVIRGQDRCRRIVEETGIAKVIS